MNQVKIGYAAYDSRGRLSSSISHDQLDQKICIRSWYNKPWNKIYRPTYTKMANKIAAGMEQIYKNKNIIGSEETSTTLYDNLRAAKWDITAVSGTVNYYNLIGICFNLAGLNFPKECSKRRLPAQILFFDGVIEIKDEIFLNSSKYLRRGDILFSEYNYAIVLNDREYYQNNNKVSDNLIQISLPFNSAVVRNGPGPQYQIITKIKYKDQITIIDRYDNWFKIYLAPNKYGYIQDQSNAIANNVRDNCGFKGLAINERIKINTKTKIYKYPMKESSIINSIAPGYYVAIEKFDDWRKLQGISGWISLKGDEVE